MTEALQMLLNASTGFKTILNFAKPPGFQDQ